jgi:photoactive yellow protein
MIEQNQPGAHAVARHVELATDAELSGVDAHGLLAQVERLSQEGLDSLPFGVVRLDEAGKVTYFSRAEAEQSGFGDRRAIGRDFFTQMAPCLGTPELMGRIERARRAGTLDILFEQVGDFGDPERELRVRVLSASGGGLWVFLQRI